MRLLRLPRSVAALAVPVVAGLYAVTEARRVRRIPRLPEASRGLDELVDADRPGPRVELVVVGDSVASGVGCTSAAASFPSVLARLVAAALDRPVRVRSVGWTGARSEQVRSEQLPVVEAMGALDIIVCSVGANDATHLTPPERVTANLREFAERAHAATGATVLLTGIPEFRCARAFGVPLRTTAWLAGRVVHERQRELGAQLESAAFVDVLEAIGEAFRHDPTLLADDRFHPSDAGAARIADAVAPAVVAALGGADDERGAGQSQAPHSA